MIENLRPLTQEQRQDARRVAHQAVIRSIGLRPTREQYVQHTISNYPPAVTRLISSLCIVLLMAAFTPSAIRLYVIGSQTFGQAVDSSVAMTAVGLATVLSAEVGQVVFSLALATLGTSRASRRLLHFSMAVTTILALVGNIQISLPGHTHSSFAWLESIAPPLLVLSTAYVLKEQVLDAVEQRHSGEQAFQTALAEWQAATAQPEDHPLWTQFYANALQDALRKANARRKETLAALTRADWRLAVHREMQADQWYAEPDSDDRPEAVDAEVNDLPAARRNGTAPKVIAAASGAVWSVARYCRIHRIRAVGGDCIAPTPAGSVPNGSGTSKLSRVESAVWSSS